MLILDTLYNDFPTTYETQINEFIVPITIAMGIVAILFVVTLIALMNIFKKANRSGIAAYIPFYNLWVLLEIVNKPKIYILGFLIPIINLICYFQIIIALGKAFRKSSLFTIGMLFLPLIFIPILGFGNSDYIGINSEAMTGKSIAKDLPIIEDKPADPINKPAQPLQERRKVEMSIGGGVYQKDYQKTLINIEDKKKIQKPNLADFRVDTSSQQVGSNISSAGGKDLFSVDFIETNPQNSSSASATPAPDATVGSELPKEDTTPVSTNESNLNTSSTIPEVVMPNNPSVNAEREETQESPMTINIPDINIPVINQNQPMENQTNDTTVSTPEKAMNENLETIIPIEPITIQENKIPEDNPVTIENSNSTPTTPESQVAESVQPESEPKTSTVNSEHQQEQTEYITCPHCGAKMKNGASKCFMCGKPL